MSPDLVSHDDMPGDHDPGSHGRLHDAHESGDYGTGSVDPVPAHDAYDHAAEVNPPDDHEIGSDDIGWSAGTHVHFDPAHAGVDVVGHPASDMSHWHLQNANDTCAVASQEFVLDSLGLDVSEAALTHLAETFCLYAPGCGTPLDSVGGLLEAFGVPVQREQGASFNELVQRLDHGDKIIVGVDAHRLWHDQDSGLDGTALTSGGANHAVQVIGVTGWHSQHPMVILNDPGTADGQGMMVSAEEFQQAWSAGDNFLVAVPAGTTAHTEPQDLGPFPALAGYYNADNTYHWTSTNTDTDPQTGATIRQW